MSWGAFHLLSLLKDSQRCMSESHYQNGDQDMRYLSFKELQEKLGGRGRSTIYRDVDLGRLPQPLKIGGRLYWVEKTVDDTLASYTQGDNQ